MTATLESAEVELVPKRGAKVTGALVQEQPEVIVNRYFSTHPGVTNTEHLVRLAPDQVKRLERKPRPEVEIWRRHATLGDAELDARFALAMYAKEEGQKAAAIRFAGEVLARDPTNRDALRLVGGVTKWKKLRTGNPHLDADLASALRTYATTTATEERRTQAEALATAGLPWKPCVLERIVRSAAIPKGQQTNRPLSMRADQLPGAVYTLFVPRSYDPTVPTPLIIGLHGGGPGGKLGDEVVGSGPSAMMFYRGLAEARGVLVACPTATRAPWPVKEGELYLRALLDEMTLLFHVDLDRIYLTGHSMGGFGTWGLGPRFAEELAAIAPAAGGGGRLGPLLDTQTPIHIFHSADDRVVGPASDRAQAKSLLGTTHDFVYTELPNAGHGYPDSVRKETFDFLLSRRLFVKRRKDAFPRSSFAAHPKPTKDEIRYLGDPTANWHAKPPTLKSMMVTMKLGGGASVRAGAWLLEHRPEGAFDALLKFVGGGKGTADARAHAATTLAAWGDASAAAALGRAAGVEAKREHALLARRAAEALTKVGGAEGRGGLERGIKAWAAFHEAKTTGTQMGFPDFARGMPVLIALTEAWAATADAEADPAVLVTHIAKGVLGAEVEVQTSSRVPQDPAALLRRLAKALGDALRGAQADEGVWETVREFLAGDERVLHALGAP